MAQPDLIADPTYRRLRIFAFDPSVSARVDTAGIGEVTIPVLWEKGLQAGPVGEYLEIVDVDPASNRVYRPVDLNDPRVLATSGLAPSESNPQFHQQMVYAVAMTTIGHFERALGRVALWSSRRPADSDEQFVRRLRIYPHALRDRNAYYSPEKKALLFGYFPVDVKDANNTPGTIVFTCLSHDIVAHETTHALLDGLHPRFNEAINPDVLAFHEAFADIVALFQHFTYPGILRDQISRTRGNLASDNLLGQLAQQFGQASGRGSALRDAIGGRGPDGRWTVKPPDVKAIESALEPHERGSILVAAVFGAFLKVYRARTADLYRIATEGTGVLREGEIHPDLAGRLATEAQLCAQTILQMCIRALDYCPPVGITFGDYLRAIVTADHDINSEDPLGCQLAMVESFRQWGIHPRGMRSMSVEGLLWPSGEDVGLSADQQHDALRLLVHQARPADEAGRSRAGKSRGVATVSWDLESDRYRAWDDMERKARAFWSWLNTAGRDLAPNFGLVVNDGPDVPRTVFRSSRTKGPTVEIHSVRSAARRTSRGSTVADIVVEIAQRRRGYLNVDKQAAMDAPGDRPPDEEKGEFRYRSGCTLLIDPRSLEIRRVIRTPGTVVDDVELARVRNFLAGNSSGANAFSGALENIGAREPFAMLHRSTGE